MFAIYYCIALLGFAPPPVAEVPAAEAGEETATEGVTLLWVRADDHEFAGLRRDLQLRLTKPAVVQYGSELPETTGLVVFVQVVATDENRDQLTLVVSDGRAYDRAVEHEPGATVEERRRAVARNVANLVEGIEAGREPADRDDVPLPAPAAPPCPTKEPPVCPAPQPAVVATPPEETPQPKPPRLEVGPRVDLGSIVGLGPPNDVDRFSGFSGSVGAWIRWRRGAVLLVEGRVGGRSHRLDSRLVRVRASIGGGYAFRPSQGNVEVDAVAALSVEPWFVLSGGDRVGFGSEGLPAFGAWARGGVGYWLGRDAKQRSVKIGTWVEFAASYLARNGPIGRVSGLENGVAVPMFRIGGPEVAVGLDATFWFGR